MADIKQAAKWMQEGKRVRVKDWDDEWPSLESADGCIIHSKKPPRKAPELDVDDLLSNDWEIAE